MREMSNMMLSIIAQIGSWCSNIIQVLNTPITELSDNQGLISAVLELFPGLSDKPLYAILFGTGLFTYIVYKTLKSLIK